MNRPLPWKDLSAEQREFQANKMAVHAAMVDRMDREIGRVLAQLRGDGRRWTTRCFLPVRQRRECRDHGPRRRPRPARRVRHRGDVPQHRPRLVEPVQHAVSPAQDLGPRRRHLDAADRPLAQGHRRPRRTAAHAGARHRPRADDPRSGRRQAIRDVGRPARAAGSRQEPASRSSRRTAR